jgi:DnaJ-class molecular chaperone
MLRLKIQNYYEILDVSPSASPFEICGAYRNALALYGDASLASYSFFPDDERKEILALLEMAFTTLVNEQARNEYDQQLIEKGAIRKEYRYENVVRNSGSSFTRDALQGLPPKTVNGNGAGNTDLEDILSGEVLTGGDLQRIRTAKGLSLEHIAARTKVRTALLQFIEEDQFDKLPSRLHLKSYLTQYVQCLQVDTASVVERYLKRIRE